MAGIPQLDGFTTYVVPLTNIPQVFEISLAGVNYLMTVKWNDENEGGWVMDLADAVSNEPIFANLPLVTGADLLEQLEYLGLNGKLYVYTDGDETAVPTLENLGVESNLYFLTETT